MNKYLTHIKIITLSLILGVGVSMALAWQDPVSSFPDGNVSAPVNISDTEQTKLGRLNVSDSFWADFVGVNGPAYVFGRLQIANTGGTSPDAGMVLISEGTDGIADWSDAPTLSCTQRSNTQAGGKTVSATCLSGEVLTGGGVSCTSGYVVSSNQQVGVPNTWQATCSQATTVTTSAFCCELQW